MYSSMWSHKLKAKTDAQAKASDERQKAEKHMSKKLRIPVEWGSQRMVE